MSQKLSVKLFALIVAIVMLAALVGQPILPARAQAGVTLKMIVSPDEGATVATYVQKFKDQTGIDVQPDFQGWDVIHDKIVTALAGGGGGYDIVFIPSANVVEFTAGDWFQPLDDMITDKNRADWLGSVVDLYTRNGHLLAMPWYGGGAHMAYNKDVLDKAGVDPASIKTWADFMAACEKVKTTKAADYCFTPSAKYAGEFYYNWGSMVASQGVDLFDKDGAPIFQNTPAALNTFQMIKDGIDKGYFDKAGVDMDDYATLIEFGKGQDAFLLDSTWSVTNANTNKDVSTILGKVGLMLIPGSDKVRSGGFLYAGGLGILKSSSHIDEAKKFLTFFTGSDAQKWHAVKGANMPTLLALYKDADIAASWSGFATLAEQVTYGKFPPQFGWFETWRHSLSSAIQDVIAGNKTPDAAVKFLVDEANRLAKAQ